MEKSIIKMCLKSGNQKTKLYIHIFFKVFFLLLWFEKTKLNKQEKK